MKGKPTTYKRKDQIETHYIKVVLDGITSETCCTSQD